MGTAYNATPLVTNAAATPLANVSVTFQITSGPNSGQTSQATTDARGHARFTYTSTLSGADTLVGGITLQGGSSLLSNQVSVTWNNPTSTTVTLAPLSAMTFLGGLSRALLNIG